MQEAERNQRRAEIAAAARAAVASFEAERGWYYSGPRTPVYLCVLGALLFYSTGQDDPDTARQAVDALRELVEVATAEPYNHESTRARLAVARGRAALKGYRLVASGDSETQAQLRGDGGAR